MKSTWFLSFALITFLVIIFFIFYSIIEYNPKTIKTLSEYTPKSINTDTPYIFRSETLKTGELTLLSWNIGYGGMGKDMDFYFDGGTRISPSETEFNYNYAGILDFISKNRADINLFQEVDIESQRSYFNDMGQGIMTLLEGSNYFSANYKNPYVPFPIKSPIGKVHSGLFSSSKFTPDFVQQIPLPSENDWPKKLFNLKRNILEMRFDYKGKELIIANIHNSAFDKGNIRDKQLRFLAERYLDEYSKGNYIILGGDFNMLFPGTEVEGSYSNTTMVNLDSSVFPKDWIFASDPKKPTNRDAGTAYNPSISGLSIIDGFLISPNIKLTGFKVHDLDFEYSDHQPVGIKIILH